MSASPSVSRGDVIADRYQIVDSFVETALWSSYYAFDLSRPSSEGPNLRPPDVLIKFVRPALLPNDATRAHLVESLRRVQGLQHPNIPHIIDVQLPKDLATVAFVEALHLGVSQGMLLRRMVTYRKSDGFPLNEVRLMGERLAAALSFLQGHAVHHGDLRLETVLLTPEGVRLCDSGLGAALPRELYLGALKKSGELELISPEVRAGQAPDVRSDVFGLAALCRHLISLGNAKTWDSFTDQRESAGAVFERAMAAEPALRTASIEGLLSALQMVLRTPPESVFIGQSATVLGDLSGRVGGGAPALSPTSHRVSLSGRLRAPDPRPEPAPALDPAANFDSQRKESWLGVEAPREMAVGETATVRAAAIRAALKKILVEEALTQDNQQLLAANLAPSVCMELVSIDPEDFSVRALSRAEQPVSEDELTVWEWLITARRAGEARTLLLTVTHLTDAQGKQIGKSLPSRRIQVKVLLKTHAPVMPGAMPVIAPGAAPGVMQELAPPQLLLAKRSAAPTPRAALLEDAVTAPKPVEPRAVVAETSVSQVQSSAWARHLRNPPIWLVGLLLAGIFVVTRLASRGFNQSKEPAAPASLVSSNVPTENRGFSLPAAGAQAAPPPPSQVSVDPAVAALSRESTQTVDGKNHAVFFATTKYDDPRWPQLKTPKSDAADVASDLQNLYGFTVETVENPKVADIRMKIRELAARSYEPGDQLLLMFSSHGDKDELLKKGWIIARDTRSDERHSAYPYSELREDIDNIPCPHILLILDVCFGGSFDPSIRDSHTRGAYQEVATEEFIARKRQYHSRLYITSVDQKTEAPEGRGHSPFAWKLLEALRSGGGSDDVLTWSELVGYLEKLRPEPRGGVFPRSQNSDPGGDFLFIRKRPR